MSKSRLALIALGAALLMGGACACEATAASPYGRTGLGSNLHRRFVLKQAVKNANAGLPVRRSEIVWNARPFAGRSYRMRSGWRRW